MRRSMDILKNNEFPKLKYFISLIDRDVQQLQEDRRARAIYIAGRGVLTRLSSGGQSAYRNSLQSYQDKAQAFIENFMGIFAEVKQVDKDIACFVENYLPQLADFTSAWIRDEAERSSSPIGWANLPQHLPSMDSKRPQVDLLKVFASREKIIPGHIVNTINEMMINNITKELNGILRQLNSLSVQERYFKREHQRSLETRALLETHIFQALNFFYENQLCTQEVLKTFFATQNTLERTYEHLRDLFNRRMGRGEDLDKAQQARLVELMLIGAIERFKRSLLFREASSEIKMIIDTVTEDRILKNWWLNTSPNSLELEAAKKWILDLVTFFGETGDSNKKFEYLISYYLYNFIRTYQISHFPTLPFNNLKENVILDTKFKVFQAGIRLHEAVNRAFDYRRLVRLPPRRRNYLEKDIMLEMVERAEIDVLDKEKEYQLIKETIQVGSKEDQLLSNWIQNNYF
ncbi:hypothetical protein O181_031801 [Austropuccinia psidii MF-1]|uniref:Uncharacterized protein n=1 Tax=Austropuccinia psidii MF-1 TaxID=1389203 RepID=A0A9Q3H5K1_9BASI|nr:hypothetical protein [Austropuccinia psidii MF-1]